MIIFLDFDGVLHPFTERCTDRAFCYLPRFESVLRDFPRTKVVVTSSQREERSVDELRTLFSADIANLVLGATPIAPIRSLEELAGSRHREILAFLGGEQNPPWVALDDDATLFNLGCPNLILCDDGFGAREEARLRNVLSAEGQCKAAKR